MAQRRYQYLCLDAMAQRPSLMNRPIVVTSKDAKLCRPSELVLQIL